jgi:hypothetical protein
MGEDVFETVHTMTDYHDGPLTGVADFRGAPHFYERLFNEVADEYSNVYQLTPIDSETFKLEMEEWAIWQRWQRAYYSGIPVSLTKRLDPDQPRHEQIQLILEKRLKTDAPRAVKATAKFKPDSPWTGCNKHPRFVRWTVVTA